MPLTGEPKKAYMKEYARKQREAQAANREQSEVVTKAAELDSQEGGRRHKSEVRSYADLTRLFYGLSPDASVDEDEAPKKKKQKRQVNPSAELIFGERCSFDQWLEYRDKARKDLFWLGRNALRKDLLPHVHQAVCDQFVQKNFDGVYYEGYTIGDVHNAFDRQAREKIAMILDSRGNYKSTINMIDAVQWMLNAPDCRIMVMTAEFKLAGKFKSQFKGYFNLAEGAKPTDFHLLFPEYILTGKDGTSAANYYCPAAVHNNQGDPSLYGNSAAANLAGWHFDIIKMDDAVSDKNANTVEARENLREKINLADSLLDQWGFKDIIGTRYWGGKDPDYYGYLLSTVSADSPLRYFCRGCWTVKEGFEGTALLELTEDMVNLTFPEKSNWKFLRSYLQKYGERNFRNQQLNEPIDSEVDSEFLVTFEMDGPNGLVAHSFPYQSAPKSGEIFIAWDWAYTDGKSSDYSVGVVGRIYQKPDGTWAICILEIIYEKWKPSELAFQIVMFNKKWNPKKTLIEKTMCADLLKIEIARRAYMHGVSLDIWWREPEHTSDAKRNRIKTLQVKLANDELWFVSGKWIADTFKQFTDYTGEKKNRGRKDDIPDAVSLLAKFCPLHGSSEMSEEEMVAQEESALRQMAYSRVFGTESMTREQPTPMPETPAVVNPLARFNIPGLRFR